MVVGVALFFACLLACFLLVGLYFEILSGGDIWYTWSEGMNTKQCFDAWTSGSPRDLLCPLLQHSMTFGRVQTLR